MQALIMDVIQGLIHIPVGVWLNTGLDPFWHTCVVAGKSYRALHAHLLDQRGISPTKNIAPLKR